MVGDHVESTHQGSETQSSPHIRSHAQPPSGIAPHTHGRAAVFQNKLKVGVELDACTPVLDGGVLGYLE